MTDEMETAFNRLIEGIMPEIEAQLREKMLPVFMAGAKAAKDESRAQVAHAMKMLATFAEVPDARPNDKPVSLTQTNQRPTPRANGGYSGVSEAVKRVLVEAGNVPAGISIGSIHEQVGKNGRDDITLQQIRSAMKQLVDTDNATRFERGYYKVGPKLIARNDNGFGRLFSQPHAMQ